MEQAESVRVAKVYHSSDVSTAVLADLGYAEFPQWMRDYVLVALIRVEACDKVTQLNEVYRRTQHSTATPWYKWPGIFPTPLANRSTMVGDVIILPSGVAYRCRWEGWDLAYTPRPYVSTPASVQSAEVV